MNSGQSEIRTARKTTPIKRVNLMKETKQDTALDGIASSILEKQKKCESLIGTIQAKGREACLLAWEIGGLLRKAKNELKGQFTKWREQSIPGLATATTSRYLALANRIPDRKDLEEQLNAGVSLTDLYREVGILPEKDVKPEEETGEDDTDNTSTSSQPSRKRGRQKFTAKVFLTALISVADKTAKLREKAPVSQWTSEDRERFRKAFTALQAIANELAVSELSTRNTLAEEVEQVSTRLK